jgi:hypothetical protein
MCIGGVPRRFKRVFQVGDESVFAEEMDEPFDSLLEILNGWIVCAGLPDIVKTLNRTREATYPNLYISTLHEPCFNRCRWDISRNVNVRDFSAAVT